MTKVRLDRLLTFEEPDPTEDAYGEDVPAWSTFTTAWAKLINERASGERYEAGQTVAEAQRVYECRWIDTQSITESMRIQEDSGTDRWYIFKIEEIGRRDWMRIYARQKDNQ